MLLFNRHQHGGQLAAASERYRIPLEEWLDLSTGISPLVYPLPGVPKKCWQRLPESNDGLEQVASSYYGSEYLLPVSGSQEAIQHLPHIRQAHKPKQQMIGIISPAYHSHKQAWEDAGFKVEELLGSEIEDKLDELDVLIIVNPTNPTAETFDRKTLLGWHQQLAARDGWLIVDEAFMDTTPDSSLITKTPKQGLIVLRSIGKFFGLAGIRLGFVWAEKALLQVLAYYQDDWSVSHPARWAGKTALADSLWQKSQIQQLPVLSQRLATLLSDTLKCPIQSTALFSYLQHDKAQIIQHLLAQQAILVRYFDTPSALRFGLPANEKQWQKLETALSRINL
jgi:cobalamin biosynthetic protein CobC